MKTLPEEFSEEETIQRREAGLKKLLATPPKPHKKKDAGLAPDASRLVVKDQHERSEPVKRSRKAK